MITIVECVIMILCSTSLHTAAQPASLLVTAAVESVAGGKTDAPQQSVPPTAPVSVGTQSAAEDAAAVEMDKAKVREIMGFDDDQRTIRKFFELVVIPLGVCLALVVLLRRGLLR